MSLTGGYSLDWPAAPSTTAAVDLASLVEAHATLLFRVALSVVRNRAEAEDIVQDTFVRVLGQQARLSEIRDLRVWLVRITWNLALDRQRRIRPDQIDADFAASLLARELPADAALIEARRIDATLRELERLPRLERQALLLSAQDELTTQQIATILDRSESAVRALLFRARTRLRERLTQGGFA